MEQSLEQDLLSSLPTCDQNPVSPTLAPWVSVSLEQSHMQASLAPAGLVSILPSRLLISTRHLHSQHWDKGSLTSTNPKHALSSEVDLLKYLILPLVQIRHYQHSLVYVNIHIFHIHQLLSQKGSRAVSVLKPQQMVPAPSCTHLIANTEPAL